MKLGGELLALPRLEMIEDLSDTWSHDLDRFPEGPAEGATWELPLLADTGPLMWAAIQRGRIGRSQLTAEYRVYAGKPYVEMRLRVHWVERRKMLKLRIGFPSPALGRFDGIMGGEVERPMTARECPLRDRTVVQLTDGSQLGIVCPDIYALDASPSRLRLTLLRSPIMAHHVPHSGSTGREIAADQGVHEFHIRFSHGKNLSSAEMDQQALAMQRPLIAADLTRGMPAKDETA